MTFEEYEQIISKALMDAYNDKDMDALTATFKKADQTLEKSNISLSDRKRFWEEVRKVVFSGRMRLERQSNSALIALMQALEREISARTAK